MTHSVRTAKRQPSVFRRLISFFSSGKVFFPLFLLFFLLLIQSFFSVREKSGQLDLFEDEVITLRAKLDERLGELEYRNSSEFVYKEALEQLGYTRPGEVIVILPDFEEEGKTSNDSEEKEESQTAKHSAEPIPNWKKWRILFFGS